MLDFFCFLLDEFLWVNESINMIKLRISNCCRLEIIDPSEELLKFTCFDNDLFCMI
jgi:hypothetical protein